MTRFQHFFFWLSSLTKFFSENHSAVVTVMNKYRPLLPSLNLFTKVTWRISIAQPNPT